MPKLDPVPYNGRIPTGDKLKRAVERLLDDRKQPADAVIALTDVYTGTTPPQFTDAATAKDQMRRWVGPNDRFFPMRRSTTLRLGCFPSGMKSNDSPGTTKRVLELHPNK